MKLAVAQIRSIAGDIAANVARHVGAVHQAAELDAELVLFPELSLTGYEPTLAKHLATSSDDPRFDLLQTESDSNSIIIGAGIPIAKKNGTEIGLIFFQPDLSKQTYSKQLLHTDEIPFFVPGQRQLLLQSHSQMLVPAICYESLQPSHAESAAKMAADVYLASVAKSAAGVAKAYAHYPMIAQRHSMTVVMANGLGPSDNFIGAGMSAIWNCCGDLVGQLDDQREGVLVFDTKTHEAASKTW